MVTTLMPQELEFKQTEYFSRDLKCKKIIFLDIDGVISNEVEPRMRGSNNCINASNLENLLYILENVEDVSVFLSSSWRYQRNLEQCNDLIKYYFGMHSVDIVGRTPVVVTPEDVPSRISVQELLNTKIVCSRGYEIKYVVDILKPDSYVILDDWDNFLDEQSAHHVRTDGIVGLTRDDAEIAIHILNR